jgi:hypothetical protein
LAAVLQLGSEAVMKIALVSGAVIYLVGVVAILSLNLAIGPVTTGLAAARAALWPLWVTTGIPNGQRLPIPFEGDSE